MSEKYLKYIPKHYKKILLIIGSFHLLGQDFPKCYRSRGDKYFRLGRARKKWQHIFPITLIQMPLMHYHYLKVSFQELSFIELLARELYVNQLKPGKTHRTFCNLYFDTICTTNFDFLIEQTLNEKHIPFSMIVSEERLPISTHEKLSLLNYMGILIILKEW